MFSREAIACALGGASAFLSAWIQVTGFEDVAPAAGPRGSGGGGQGGGGGGGGGGAGGRGGGCSLPGDGTAASTPWTVALGPVDPAVDWPLHPSFDAELVSDKIV